MYLHVVFSPDTQVPTTQDKGNPRAAAAKKAVQLPPASTFSIQKKNKTEKQPLLHGSRQNSFLDPQSLPLILGSKFGLEDQKG